MSNRARMLNEIARICLTRASPTKRELQVQQKRELAKKEEGTIPARIFLPAADIYETGNALSVAEMKVGVLSLVLPKIEEAKPSHRSSEVD